MKHPAVLQDPFRGGERADIGLRLVGALAARRGVEVAVLCFGGAAGRAGAGRHHPGLTR